MHKVTAGYYADIVRETIRIIAHNLDTALDLTALAAAARLSPFHFHRLFRGMTGETPLGMHRRLRLERAALALQSTARPVTDVAFEAGYETHEAFTRAFRAAYACPPSQFRDGIHHRATGVAGHFRTQLAARTGVHYSTNATCAPNFHTTTGESTMNVEIRHLPAVRLATVSHIGPYNRIVDAFGRLGAIAGPAGLIGPDSAMIAIYYDDPESTPADALRADAGFSVPDDAQLPANLEARLLPAGRYACTVHAGSYATLGDTWARFLGEWLPRSGSRLRDSVSFERYLNTPMDAADEDLRTELFILLD